MNFKRCGAEKVISQASKTPQDYMINATYTFRNGLYSFDISEMI
jgi:hypothetical protein